MLFTNHCPVNYTLAHYNRYAFFLKKKVQFIKQVLKCRKLDFQTFKKFTCHISIIILKQLILIIFLLAIQEIFTRALCDQLGSNMSKSVLHNYINIILTFFKTEKHKW